jgi:hypothetical protein
MKQSHLTTPRTLDECHFTPGYRSIPARETFAEKLAGYALAIFIGCALAAVIVYGWSA